MSVDGESWPLPRPHLVIGTQNPMGQLGTYPLVESQLDRFGLSTTIGYPDAEVETRLVLHNGGRYALDSLAPVADPSPMGAGHRRHGHRARGDGGGRVRRLPGPGHPHRRDRPPGCQSPAPPSPSSARPRPTPSSPARAYVTPQDVQAVAVACLAHRLVAEGSGGDGPALVGRILAEAPVPPT